MSKRKETLEPYSIRLPAELVQYLRNLKGVSASDFIRQALEEKIKAERSETPQEKVIRLNKERTALTMKIKWTRDEREFRNARGFLEYELEKHEEKIPKLITALSHIQDLTVSPKMQWVKERPEDLQRQWYGLEIKDSSTGLVLIIEDENAYNLIRKVGSLSQEEIKSFLEKELLKFQQIKEEADRMRKIVEAYEGVIKEHEDRIRQIDEEIMKT